MRRKKFFENQNNYVEPVYGSVFGSARSYLAFSFLAFSSSGTFICPLDGIEVTEVCSFFYYYWFIVSQKKYWYSTDSFCPSLTAKIAHFIPEYIAASVVG